MKKYLFLLMISGLLISCSNNYVESGRDNYSIEESVEKTTEESNYTIFEMEILEKYRDFGITDVKIAPYSKGIDIIFTTDKKDFLKEDFDKLSQESVNSFKEGYGVEEKVGVSLDYQPTPDVDAISLFNNSID